MNRPGAHYILRLGLAITFVWIGIFILRDPIGWAGFIKPWAQELIPGSLEGFMRGVGIFDIVIGGFLALGIWVRLAALLAALHLASILAASGVDAVTVRDIGLLGGSLALVFWPAKRSKDNDQKDEFENQP